MDAHILFAEELRRRQQITTLKPVAPLPKLKLELYVNQRLMEQEKRVSEFIVKAVGGVIAIACMTLIVVMIICTL